LRWFEGFHRTTDMSIALRAASTEDHDWLYGLHTLTMRDVIEQTWIWDEAWQRQDFERRIREYLAFVIEHEARDVGGLVVETRPESTHIHEVQVLPEFQGRGIGSAVIQQVIAQAASRGVPVTLSVALANSRARRLYDRLGFQVIDKQPPLVRMRYSPAK